MHFSQAVVPSAVGHPRTEPDNTKSHSCSSGGTGSYPYLHDGLGNHEKWRLTAGLLMPLAWTKSGIDFVAPFFWYGTPVDTTGYCYLASAVVWIAACCTWLAITLRPSLAKSDCIPAALFIVAAIFYIATLQSAPGQVGLPLLIAICSYIAAFSWLLAAVLWTIFEFGFIRDSALLEYTVVGLWGICGFAFGGTCVDESLSPWDKYTCFSSSAWWGFGVATWLVVLYLGVRLMKR
mmetsp:Transcript_9837/g.17830  ORF Transcript_9837/g.17830 Transcript_9837/m.17830 type:complete len:235 (+) Transcript_9837:63-767(+)